MRVARLVPAAFVYIQGFSLANLIYLIFFSQFVDKCGRPLFRVGQLAVLLALLIAQYIAFVFHPHAMPLSAIASVLGLLAFAIRADVLFDWDGSAQMREAFRRVLVWVLVVYVLDSLLRVKYLSMNFTGWSDYELKEQVKTSLWLADDTNTLTIHVVFLYLISRSVGLLRAHPWRLRALFIYLSLASYSRAGLAAMLLVVLVEEAAVRNWLRARYLLPALLMLSGAAMAGLLWLIRNTEIDSSVVSKADLVVGSLAHWVSADWWRRLFGSGYFSNIDVGIYNWASGHSIIYYGLVDFGAVGTLLMGTLILRSFRSIQARMVFALYCIMGLSVFRFDLLFLYITMFFVEHVSERRPHGDGRRSGFVSVNHPGVPGGV